MAGYTQNLGDGYITYPCGKVTSRDNAGELLLIMGCQPKKEEAKMKEFDLRPFEILSNNFWQINILDGKSEMHRHYGFKSWKEAAKKAAEYIIDEKWWDCTFMVVNTQSHQWTFDDIEIGCFFKVVGKHGGSSICIKTDRERFIWLYDYKMASNSQDRFLGAYGKYEQMPFESLEEANYKITNVYKCDELYKHFMIEELKS
jgi:hypothetical protein